MFDIFGFKRRRMEKEAEEERRRLEDIQKKKLMYREIKKKVDEWHDLYYNEEKKKADELTKISKEACDKLNSICPKCGSTNIINKIKRNKGEIHGESCGSLLLHSGYAYHNGKIDGKLDTYPVNRCKDCENEWLVEEYITVKPDDEFSNFCSFKPDSLYYRINEYLDMEYDPNDIKEPYNSLEEKRNALVEKYSKGNYFKTYRYSPKYMIEYALYGPVKDDSYDEDKRKRFGYIDEYDKYSYRMPDDIWEVVKKIIGWEGPFDWDGNPVLFKEDRMRNHKNDKCNDNGLEN